jgi:hypothetical protein
MAQKVTKSNKDLLELVRSLNTVPAPKGSKREAKLLKIANKIKPLFEQYNEKREELRLEYAHSDANGVLDLDANGGYKFTKDSLKGLNAKLKSLLDETFEFYQFTFSKEGIDDLDFLAGWVEGIEKQEQKDEELQ